MKTATSSASNPRRCRSALRAGALAFGVLFATAVAGEVRIFPSGETLPANHLKFYLHFAEPMREGVFLEHCRLLDERGQPVPEPFRETELWSEDRRRLTLWLHPGRQKTGVNLNEEFGPVLEPERQYTLVISGAWPTERGALLGGETRKVFSTGTRTTQQLDTAAWKLLPPRSGGRHVLDVRFPAPLDHALLHRCFRVLDPRGNAVLGEIEIADAERTWRFTPAAPWESGEHRLVIESILEDLAGNSLARPFERDLQAPPPKPVGRTVELPFNINQ